MPKSVLVVDDCSDIREVLKLLLEADGWVVSIAADALEVRAHLDGHTPKCILLDFRLAGSNAIDVLDIIRSKCPSVDVVLMTAGADAEVQAKRLNLEKFLTKPFDCDQLYKVLGRTK